MAKSFKDKLADIDPLLWAYSAIFGGVFIILLVSHYLFGVYVFYDKDIFNWASLVVASGFGVAITYTVWFKSKRDEKQRDKLLDAISMQQNEISKLVVDIKKIEEKQQILINEQHSVLKNEHDRIERWKIDWGSLILSNLDSIKMMYEILETWFKNYRDNPSDRLKADIIRTASMNGNIVENHIQNIKHYLPKIESYFDEPTLGLNLSGIFEQLSILFKTFHMDYHWESNDIESTFRMIAERKGMLEDLTKRLKKEIPESNL